ncbi:MAG: GAF domain-containing protein [Chloroflexi bacterium CFX4]|nr:GAF domain-containing protein [Chloroflexi bacterium CFX4]MDL1923233.1 GAF domain-containing protein [Chloroflexi bacterium CFX3]
MPLKKLSEIRLSVRTQLNIIFISLISLALFIIGTLGILSGRETQWQLWRDRQVDALNNVGNQIRSVINQVQRTLTFLKNIRIDEHFADLLNGTLQASPSLLEIALLDANGQIIADAVRETTAFGDPNVIAQSEWFEEAQEAPEGLFYLGELSFTAEGLPYLILAASMPDGGVIAANLSMAFVNDLLARNRLGETGVAYLAEGEGELIAHTDPSLVSARILLLGRSEFPATEDIEFIGELLGTSGNEGLIASQYINLQGVDVLGTSKVIDGTDLILFSEVSAREINDFSRSRLGEIIAATVLVIVGTIIIVGQAVRRGVSRPLAKLLQGAREVAEGNLMHQVPISYRDEIGEVTESFNAMTRQLRERTVQKVRQDIRLRALYEVVASSTDVDMQLSEALRIGTELLGLEIGTISHIDGDSLTVLYAQTPDGSLKRGQKFAFKQTYCDLAYQANGLVSIENVGSSDYKGHPCYTTLGLESYIGVPLTVGDKRFGTLSFSSGKPRSEQFAAFDKDFFLLMGQWVSSLLERRQSELALLRRDAILSAVSFTAQKLLSSVEWENNAEEILAQLGKAAAASRVYIFQNQPTLRDGQWFTDQRYEWVAEGIKPEIDNPDLQNLNMSAAFPRWVAELSAGRPISGIVRDFDANEREILEPQSIVSLVVLPIMVDGQWWGFIGFDECLGDRVWDALEIDLLRAVASDLGAAIARQQSELALLRRDALLAAVSLSQQQLLTSARWESVLPQILMRLGGSLSASRAYIFQKLPNTPEGKTLVDMRYEWVAEGIEAFIDAPDMRELPISDIFPDWLADFQDGRVVSHAAKDVEGVARDVLDSQGIVSLAVLPIFVDGQWWGLLGFDECLGERVWDELELELLGTMAADLGAAIARQNQEAIVRESRERLLQIANGLKGAIYEFYVEGDQWRIGYISQGIYAVSGVTAEEVMTDLGTLVQHFHPQDLQPFVDSVNAVLIDGSNWQFEGRLYHRETGELRWWRGESIPTFTESGRVIFKGIFMDVTDRRQAQEQVQTQNEALVKANRELAVARRQAEVASKLKSQFLATMSHELRTPLNAVIGYSQLQLAGMVGELNPEQLAYQERILVNAQHLLHLINEVLDLSKIEAGRLELAEKPFSVRACLSEVMTQNKVLADNKGLAFTLEVDEHLPETLVGDYGRIKQIIINLVSNAIKFTDEGSVAVAAVLQDEATWRISVTDSGAGIPPHLQEVIFDEFHQAENGLDRGGTGLGLAIVRKLVLMMRGNIRLSSEVGRGSTFTVTLPLVTEANKAEALSSSIEG